MTTFFHLFIQSHPQREFASQNNKPLPRISPNIYFQLFIDFKITFSKCTLWVFCLTVSLFVSPSPHLSENWSRLPGIPKLSSNISLGLRPTPFSGSTGCLKISCRTECCWSPKILTKIECCGAKYYPGHNLEALDPAVVLVVRNEQKNNIWSEHKITSS